MIESQPRIRKGEIALAVWALIGLIGGTLSCFNGEFFWRGNPSYVDPFSQYHANLGIRLINETAFILDASIFLMVTVAALRRIWSHVQQIAVIWAAAFAAALTWFELWYGSTFYYGEVRDKQALPFGVNNAGALGSLCFLTYIIWRVQLPSRSATVRTLVRVAVTVAVAIAHYLLPRLLEQRWNLWQS
jgi:hypothetical protein